MSLIQFADKKFVLPALVASIVLLLCPVDHLIPRAEVSAHSETALAECMPDVCVTLGSKKTVSQERSPQAKLLPLPASPFIPFSLQTEAFRFTTIGDSAPPPTLSKLYQVHATYLI